MRWLDDTVEHDDKAEQCREQHVRDDPVRRHTRHGLSKCRIVKRITDAEQELGVSCPIWRETDGHVPAEVEEVGCEDIVREFNDLRSAEGRPGIHSGRQLPDFARVAEVDVHDLDLYGDGGRKHGHHETRKDLVLGSLYSVLHLGRNEVKSK